MRSTLRYVRAGVVAAALLLSGGVTSAQDGSADPPVSCPTPPVPSVAPSTPLSMPEDYRLGLLDQVWQQLRDQYLDPGMHGLDWDAVHTDVGQRMLITLDAGEAYQAISDMVALLEDPDTFFVSALDLEASALDPTYGGIGILVDSTTAADPSAGLRVVYVFPGSPALAAGIQPRDIIVGVAGDPCVSPQLIRGPVGTSVELQVRSPGGEPRTVDVQRQRIAPSYQVTPDRVPGRPRYGYVRVISLAGDAGDQVDGALTSLLDQGDLDGLVLDLRHASAGELEVTRHILGDFVGGEVATLLGRDADTPFVVEAGPLRDRLRDIPVAVLVDAATDGEAERLAAVLQAERDAVVVGRPTAGHTQIVTQTSLPEGSLLQLVTGGMLLQDGTRLDGHGVVPDIVREDDWMTQPADEDTWENAAVRELRRSGAGSSQAPAP
jgi:carboxyl-terminal processing protease